MKKPMTMCLIIVLCLCMSACGKGRPEQSENLRPSGTLESGSINSMNIDPLVSIHEDSTDTSDADSSQGTGLMPSASAKSDDLVLERPPALVISTINNADSVIASCGNYQWRKEMPDGTTGSIIACGAHPLDEINERATLYTALPSESLPSLPEGQMPEALYPAFYLNFGDVPPETVTVCRWPSAYIGHTSEYAHVSEDVMVDIIDGFVILPQGDGEFVYEVQADWSEIGHADYVFNTVAQAQDAD